MDSAKIPSSSLSPHSKINRSHQIISILYFFLDESMKFSIIREDSIYVRLFIVFSWEGKT